MDARGLYVVDDVYFTMAGDWDLIIKVKKGGTEDSAIIPVPNVK